MKKKQPFTAAEHHAAKMKAKAMRDAASSLWRELLARYPVNSALCQNAEKALRKADVVLLRLGDQAYRDLGLEAYSQYCRNK